MKSDKKGSSDSSVEFGHETVQAPGRKMLIFGRDLAKLEEWLANQEMCYPHFQATATLSCCAHISMSTVR